MTPIPTPIFHITHVDNLVSILRDGGLKNCGVLRQSGVTYTNIAHQSIQDRRQSTSIPCGPRGLLHDYVPFYFAPRSPMLYAIGRANVEGYTGGQVPVVHLVSTAQAVAASGVTFVFSDGHGVMEMTDFYDDLVHLDQVDWDVMKLRYWHDTPEDGDRKRRRQAEFLVHGFFPWRLVHEIGVMNATVRAQVDALLQGMQHRPRVKARAAWYY